MMKVGQATLVATAKNEAPYLLEWIAHHRIIGFDNIVIFQNDSDDTTHQTLKCLKSLGIVNYRYNRAPRGSHQNRAYIRATRQTEYRQADWIMALDIDEYLCIKVGNGTIADWFSFLEEADLIYVNWRIFGSSGKKQLIDGLTTEHFTLAERSDRLRSAVSPFKSMFRRDIFYRPGVHRPVAGEWTNSPRIINGSGVDEKEFKIRNFQCSDPECLRYAQVNHYIVRDAASFVLKSFKGSAHQANRKIEDSYWSRGDRNEVEELTLRDRVEELKEEMSKLDMLSNGRLMKWRKRALAQHRKKFKEILEDPKMSDLYDFCVNGPIKYPEL